MNLKLNMERTSLLLEKLPNAGCYQLYLPLPSPDSRPKIRLQTSKLLEIDFGEEERDVEQPLVHLTFEEDLDPSSCSLQLVLNQQGASSSTIHVGSNGHLEVRLGIRKSQSEEEAKTQREAALLASIVDRTWDKPPASSSSTSFFQQFSLSCNFCHSRLLRKDHLLKRLASLPSEHWLELRDLWICHEGDVKHFPKDAIQPRPELILIGGTYLLLHPSSLAPGVFETTTISTATTTSSTNATTIITSSSTSSLDQKTWQHIHCKRCKSSLGAAELVGSTSATTQEFLGVKLWKHRLRGEGPGRQWFENWTEESKLGVDLVETMTGLSCNRVFLCGLFTKKVFATVMILNTNSFIKLSSDSFSSSSSPSPLRPAVKLAFVDCLRSPTEASLSVATWKARGGVTEQLFYPEEECDQMLQILNARNALFPPSRSQFNRMSLAYILLPA